MCKLEKELRDILYLHQCQIRDLEEKLSQAYGIVSQVKVFVKRPHILRTIEDLENN